VAQNTRIKNNYDNACGLSFDDHLTVNYNIKYHHYTLYYYDRAGNLVKTVPPEGVLQGTTSRAVHPAHRLVTEYAYNSYGQMVRQKTPDGGETKFWYDSKGRLRFSQNAKQQPLDKMSYSKYDELGRIVETGEIVQTPLIAQTEVNNLYYPNQGSGTDITVTVYSTPYIPVRSYLYYGDQEYLQNRVSYTFTDQDGNPATLNDYVSTVYSYDPHGNVEWLVQSLPDLGNNSIAYEYDLVSGNVIKVKYNEYAEDKLHQRYSYDAEKRLESVESTKDERFWERDASYSYYLHGPLKRMELGHDKLQGMDYLYTLQGWLKAINHANTANDPGKDATAATPNALYARDVYSQMLGYYAGDFVSSTTNYNSQTSNPYYLPALTGKDLYNGNISTWTSRFDEKAMSGIPTFTNKANAVGKTFAYDELNRLMQANYLVQSNTNVWGLTSQYKEDFTYDANGNIKTLQRKDNTGAGIDGLTYNYPMAGSFITSNRLQYVDDAISTPANSTDIEDQNAGNYTYDFIGNLTKDIKEGINSIEWNLYGKISKILKTDGTQLNYLYDAAGNRVYKKVTASNGSVFTRATYYVRDASGNPMALYERKVVANPGNGNFIEKYNLTEQPLYGSSRIGGRTIPEGSIEKSQEIATANSVGEPLIFPSLNTYAPYQRTLNRKRYELNDHLGNVRAVISDYKLPVDDGTYVNGVKQNSTPDGIRDFYVPNLVNLTDFYSFGSPLTGRNYTSTPSYRYGFNSGSEKDDEIYGIAGSLYTTEFRELDNRLGRMWRITIENKTTANSFLLHGGELIFGKENGAKTFNEFFNKTPLLNTLSQRFEFTVPFKK
jgi:YD repeat-containing protein